MNFKIGDRVRYELAWFGGARWEDNLDRGGSGQWAVGVVIDVGYLEIVVEGRAGQTRWPTPNHPLYDPAQWHFEGYLELADHGQPNRYRKEAWPVANSDFVPPSMPSARSRLFAA